MSSMTDTDYMRSALAIARTGLGRTAPNPSVGCVLVNKAGHMIARARSGDGGRPHAETVALEQAGPLAKGCTAYVTLEPCAHHGKTPPCTGALIAAGIKRVVMACEDPDPRTAGQGARQLHVAGIEVTQGVLEAEAARQHAGFFLHIKQDRPLVTLKAAVSKDGKIAGKAGEKTRITGALAHMRSHMERARHDAILVGIGTVLVDDPLLTTRLPDLEHKIIRVVLDRHLRIPLESRLVQSADTDPLWVFYEDDPDGKKAKLESKNIKIFQGTEIESVLKTLSAEKVLRLLVEGGAKVNTAFLEAGLCDRFLLFRSGQEIGAAGLDALTGHDIGALERGFGLKPQKTAFFGEDLLEIYTGAA